MWFKEKKFSLKLNGILFPILLFVFGTAGSSGFAQDTVHLTLARVLRQGLDSSKTLHISTAKVDEALAQLKQVQDKSLPDIKAGLSGSEAFILTRTLQIEGLTREPIHLPSSTTLYLGTVSVTEPIFEGNQLKYARQSAKLLHQIAQLNVQNDSEAIEYNLIQAYVNIYKIGQNQKIAAKELLDVQGRLEEVMKFEQHGLATENDVLRFRLQKAKVELEQIDLANERAIANYAMCIALGIPGGTYLETDSLNDQQKALPDLNSLIADALFSRKEIEIYNHKQELSTISIHQAKDERLPTLGAGFTGYYINPNSQFIPPENSFLVPVMLGLNLSWHISSLYTSKHKIAAARIQENEVETARSAAIDQIKIDVNQQYRSYLQSLKKIEVLQTAVNQAKENDRIMELKYQNQLATTTDRIDAQTMLYQTLTNLSIAKADAVTAYYQVLRATGTLTSNQIH